MNLAIDIGNQYTKLAIFNGSKLLYSAAYKKFKLKNLIPLFDEYGITHSILSDVSGDIIKTEAYLKEHTQLLYLTHDTPIPITNKYDTPRTLGLDRIAAVCGAQAMFPNNHVLVIDAGTCITYEYMNDKREYMGGGISPGIKIRFKSLHRYTGKLPLLKKEPIQHLIGSSTASSMLSGVLNGTAAEINGIIERYVEMFPEIKVLITGGDAEFFESYFKSDIFAVPNLVLKGLNQILLHNS